VVRPVVWRPSAEPSPAELAVIKAVRRAKLFVFLRQHRHELFSEEFQAEFYRQTLAEASRIGFLRGMSPWILMDFRSPRRQLPGIQDYWNRKGLLSERGERKKAFYVLQKFYKEMAETYRAR
jgi:hypothetical protein